MTTSTAAAARVCGTDLRRAGYECDWGRRPVTGPQLFAWSHGNTRRHPGLVRRLCLWGLERGHGDRLVAWTPGAVSEALRWLVDEAPKD